MKTKLNQDKKFIKVNLNKKNKNEKHKKVNNITYVKIKENYDSYLKLNKNMNSTSTLFKTSNKGRFKIIINDYNKDENNNLSLEPFIHKKRINYKKREEVKKSERNLISMRRVEYSMKVKNAANVKKSRNHKYDITKIIIIQKWVKGYLLRSFLSNASEVEKIINEFVNHINKFIYFKFNFFKKLKKYNLINIKTINDNVIENKKYFTFINDNVSISNINTNVTTNTFTNNNTFSAGPETPEIFENRKTNRELLINSKRNYKGPSIRELLMVNTDSDKNKNKTINKNNINGVYIKKIQKAKSSSHIKKNENIIYSKNKQNYKSIQICSFPDLKLKTENEINNKTEKVTNLRTLLFNKNEEEKIYKKPLMNLLYISKVSYHNKEIINKSPKSEKLFLPKIYQIFSEENSTENVNINEKNENINFCLEKIIIDEIKEAKEDEEDDSQSQFIKRINTSFSEDISEMNINNKNKNYNIYSSSSFYIKPCLYDKKKILIVLLLEKQIKLYLRPYIYNLLKNYMKNKTIFS